MNLEHFLAKSRELAREAGTLLLSQFHNSPQVEFKAKYNPVTEMDRQSEKLIADALKKSFPEHGILAEEGTSVQSQKGCCWIIDPLDGTTNYAHGLHFFSVSIALVSDGKPIVGAVYAPRLEEEFYASLGGGAFLNGKKIKVSEESDFAKSFLATGEPYEIRENLDYHLALFKKFVEKSLAIRRFGSASLDLCNVACGRVDGYWEASLKPWDAAAGLLILEEAGGKVTDYQGNPYVLEKSNTLAASNNRLHGMMARIFSS